MSCGSVEVIVPASTANLGAGLDCLGLALDIRNQYIFSLGTAGPDITIKGEGAGYLPVDEEHPAYMACMKLLTGMGKKPAGLSIRQVNCVPFSGGLGNSATAVVAGVVAAGLLAGKPFSQEDVLREAAALEGHPDNVAPAYLGGLVVCASNANGRVINAKVSIPDELIAVLAIPQFMLSTSSSRRVLPAHVSLGDALFNVSRCGLFVAALASNQLDLLPMAMEDKLHQHYRAALVPGLNEVCQAAQQAGAFGAALSGAGPSVVALCSRNKANPSEIGQAMVQAFALADVEARTIITKPSETGTVYRYLWESAQWE